MSRSTIRSLRVLRTSRGYPSAALGNVCVSRLVDLVAAYRCATVGKLFTDVDIVRHQDQLEKSADSSSQQLSVYL